jgi:Lon protease-like protein
MVSRCIQNDAPFGVLLIREGSETESSTTHHVGTLARITDWYQGSDGLLGITAIGEERFRLISTTRQDDGLNVGDVQILENEPNLPLPDEYQEMAGILDDASWVTSRFVEILPIDLEEKQRCLEQSDPIERLGIVRDLLASSRN